MAIFSHRPEMVSRYSGDDTLCKVVVKTLPVRVEGRMSFFPKDIVIVDGEAAGFWDNFRASPNKTAIAKVLLAKHLRQINPQAEKTEAPSIVGYISSLQGDVQNEE